MWSHSNDVHQQTLVFTNCSCKHCFELDWKHVNHGHGLGQCEGADTRVTVHTRLLYSLFEAMSQPILYSAQVVKNNKIVSVSVSVTYFINLFLAC